MNAFVTFHSLLQHHQLVGTTRDNLVAELIAQVELPGQQIHEDVALPLHQPAGTRFSVESIEVHPQGVFKGLHFNKLSEAAEHYYRAAFHAMGVPQRATNVSMQGNVVSGLHWRYEIPLAACASRTYAW